MLISGIEVGEGKVGPAKNGRLAPITLSIHAAEYHFGTTNDRNPKNAYSNFHDELASCDSTARSCELLPLRKHGRIAEEVSKQDDRDHS